MKTKFLAGVVAGIVLVSFCSLSIAETIYLRDGRVVKEKIVEKGSYYIITMDGDVPNRYYTGQIDHIEEDAPEYLEDLGNIDITRFPGILEEKVRLIVAFIKSSGVRHNMEQNIGQVIDRAPAQRRAEFKALFNIDEIIQRLIPVYDKYYSKEELKAIIEFYESPAGKKILEATPEIMKESVQVSIDYFKGKTAQ